MSKLYFILIIHFMSNPIFAQMPTMSESISINGKQIYYEKYGEGQPLFLLHGYTQSSVAWKPFIKDYADEFEVYLIDLPGHGNSEPFRQDLSIKSVAEDLDSLIKYLKLEQILAIGFSFGGDVLYQLALQNPSSIKSMITIGAVGSWTINDFPIYLESFTFENKNNFPWLEKSHAGDEQIKALMEQFKNYSVFLSDEELLSITTRILIMVGDRDEGLDLQEAVRAKNNLVNSQLWILPNVSHGAHEGKTKDEFIIKSKAFLHKK